MKEYWYVFGIHKEIGTFENRSFNEKLAKSIGCNLAKSGYFLYVSVHKGQFYHPKSYWSLKEND